MKFRIGDWFGILKRCRCYAKKLDQIDKVVGKFEQKKNLDLNTKELIKEIDKILD